MPRRLRGDGWLPGLQRIFIAALAMTGSRNKAVHAAGKVNASVDNLRAAEGAEGFNAAYERALSLYEERHLAKAVARLKGLEDGLAARDGYGDVPAAAEAAKVSPPAPRLTEADAAAKVAQLESMLETKLAAERRLREEGRLAEANLALRQASRIEVMIELSRTTEPATVDAFMGAMRTASGVDEVQVLDTEASRASDAARRAAWIAAGAPSRPAPPPGPGCEVGAKGGIEEREDCRTWTDAVRGGRTGPCATTKDGWRL